MLFLPVLAVAVSACTSGLGDSPTAASGSTSAASPATSTAPSQDACRPGPGKRVEDVPDVTVPAVHQEATVIEDQRIGGRKVPGFTVPAVDIPARVVDAGCIVYYEAPAGCLGAVLIAGFTIPAISVPGYQLPGYDLGGGRVQPAITVPGRSVPAVTVQATRVEQVCQDKPRPGDTYISSVYRPSLYRESGYRASLYRESGYRGSAVLGSASVPAASVPSLSLPSVSVPSQSVPSKSIKAVVLDGADGTTVLPDDQRTTYSTKTDVLFDFGKAGIKPAAVPTLRRITAEISRRFPTGTITVDGHTDALGTEQDNLDLSRRRAEAITRWLVTEGGIDAARITTHGYGEAVPVAPNTMDTGADNPEGRATNRRVMISAAA